jgi:hypothetical protein
VLVVGTKRKQAGGFVQELTKVQMERVAGERTKDSTRHTVRYKQKAEHISINLPPPRFYQRHRRPKAVVGNWLYWTTRPFDRAVSIESRQFPRIVFSTSLGQGAESKLKLAIEPIALVPWCWKLETSSNPAAVKKRVDLRRHPVLIIQSAVNSKIRSTTSTKIQYRGYPIQFSCVLNEQCRDLRSTGYFLPYQC